MLLQQQQDHACCSETLGRQIETSPETSQRLVKHEKLLFHLGDKERTGAFLRILELQILKIEIKIKCCFFK